MIYIHVHADLDEFRVDHESGVEIMILVQPLSFALMSAPGQPHQ